VLAVQLPGSYEGAVVQVAAGLCGAVLLPVVMIYGPREMDFVLRRSVPPRSSSPGSTAAACMPTLVLGGLSGCPR